MKARTFIWPLMIGGSLSITLRYAQSNGVSIDSYLISDHIDRIGLENDDNDKILMITLSYISIVCSYRLLYRLGCVWSNV